MKCPKCGTDLDRAIRDLVKLMWRCIRKRGDATAMAGEIKVHVTLLYKWKAWAEGSGGGQKPGGKVVDSIVKAVSRWNRKK